MAYFNCILIAALEGTVPTDATHPLDALLVNASGTMPTLPEHLNLERLTKQTLGRAQQHMFSTAVGSQRRSIGAGQVVDFLRGRIGWYRG